MNEITIKDFMECVQYKITEGHDYLWRCYGDNAYSLDYWNQKNGADGVSIHIVFDRIDQTVYEMQAWHYGANREYRWIHPDYLSLHATEADQRGLDGDESLDGRLFIDLDLAEDMLEKANAIFNGLPYDTRVLVNVDMDDSTLNAAMRLAHEQDITLNEYVESILRKEIDRLKAANEQARRFGTESY